MASTKPNVAPGACAERSRIHQPGVSATPKITYIRLVVQMTGDAPTMVPTYQQWVEKAQYDLGTAQAMLDTGRYIYVLFFCQQAVEKMLKAIIAKRTDEMPPRIHKLVRLAEKTGIDIDEDRMRFLGVLSSYYVQSRHPEEMDDLLEQASSQVAQDVLRKTQDMLTWLKSVA
ncbi:MAG: HEPN domain-containing protein [candidate division Zixibacteria bacterium]|nr:HEPN domain-containing protein [candidate division Zixibacteria bacterium]